MSKLNKLSSGLATYSGRDACIRVTAYFTLYLYGLLVDLEKKSYGNNTPLIEYLLKVLSFEQLVHLAQSFRLISKYFGTTRLIMRFFDDIPAVNNLVKHFSSNQENDNERVDKNNNKIEKV